MLREKKIYIYSLKNAFVLLYFYQSLSIILNLHHVANVKFQSRLQEYIA